jgi:hypothetical protein
MHFGRQTLGAHGSGQLRGSSGIHQHRMLWTESAHLLQQTRPVAVGRECHHGKTPRMTLHHIQRAAADATGAAEHHQPAWDRSPAGGS